MKYVTDTLEEFKTNLRQKNKRTQELINHHQQQIEALKKENIIREIQIFEINQKINYIKKDTI